MTAEQLAAILEMVLTKIDDRKRASGGENKKNFEEKMFSRLAKLGANDQYEEWAFDFKTVVGSKSKDWRDVLLRAEAENNAVKAKELWMHDQDKAKEMEPVKRMKQSIWLGHLCIF